MLRSSASSTSFILARCTHAPQLPSLRTQPVFSPCLCFHPAWLRPQALGEIKSSFFAVHPRLKPLLNLASTLHPSPCGRALYEVHATVEVPSQSQGGIASFREGCAACSVKAVVGYSESSDLPTRATTSSYVRGTLRQAHYAAFRLAMRLMEMGFTVERIKVEAELSNVGVPVTDCDAAALSPHSYFECQCKLWLARTSDFDALIALLQPHGARLSRHSLWHAPGSLLDRYVSLRLYDLGRDAALVRMDDLVSDLEGAGYFVVRNTRKYVVYDSRPFQRARDARCARPVDAEAPVLHREQPPPYVGAQPHVESGARATSSTGRCASTAPASSAASTSAASACVASATAAALGSHLRDVLVRSSVWVPTHPLRSADVTALVAALRAEALAGRVRVAEKGPAECPTVIYHHGEAVEPWTLPLLLARGIVTVEPLGAAPVVLATPLPKFFEDVDGGNGIVELCYRCRGLL